MAADSRFTFEFNGGRWFCDNVHKITEPNNAKRVAITVTGYSSIWKFNNLPLSEVCTHISQNAAEFDADSVVKSAIEAKPRGQQQMSTSCPVFAWTL